MSDSEWKPNPPAAVPSTAAFRPDIFRGKVLFATGGGSGIVNTMVHSVMAHGGHAAIMGRKADRLAKAADELVTRANNGTRCIATPGDVRKYEDLQAAVKRVVEEFGRLDFVICGAAGNFLAPLVGLSPKGFKTVQEIDLLGTYHTYKATIDEVKKTRGSYVHVSATLHYTGIPWQGAASAAKAGVDALSQSIAVEEGPFGVRSNVIAPGLIGGTEGADRLTPDGADDYVVSQIPIQRKGDKHDIANAGVFLFSEAATFVTGAVFVVDGGGQHFQGPWLPYPTSQVDPKSLRDLVRGSRL